ncbi:MAG: BrnT family toxin [Vicinamibacteria bacterium]
MVDLRFEWDSRKAQSNLRKHRVSFEEAQAVFFDEHALLLDDPDEASGEDRFVIMGLSAAPRILVVRHCLRALGRVIRIISARKAGKAEQALYWARLKR